VASLRVENAAAPWCLGTGSGTVRHMAEVFAGHVLVRRLDSGGQVEFHQAHPVAPGQADCLLVRLPEGSTRWPPWADPALATTLVHPNIVRLLESHLLADRPYARLEFVPGVDLRELLALEQLPPTLSCFIVEEVCRGLVAALQSRAGDGTELRWVHGQLSPRVIRVSPAGQVKVGGFGLGGLKPEEAGAPSKRLDERVMFLAPEQVAGEVQDDLTPQIDVFQLGAVLHAALSRQSLVSGTTTLEYLRAVLETRKTQASFSRLDDGVPLALRQVVTRMLASSPEDRFRDAGEVLAALESVSERVERSVLARELGAVVQRRLEREPPAAG